MEIFGKNFWEKWKFQLILPWKSGNFWVKKLGKVEILRDICLEKWKFQVIATFYKKIKHYDSKKYTIIKHRTLSEKVDDWVLSYQYTNKLCILKEQEQAIAETLKNHVFDDIEFVPEPDNPFDDGAVAIYHNNEKVGYIYKDDNAQHMVRDWVRMERYFCGYISKYDSENEEIYYDIGFYKKK